MKTIQTFKFKDKLYWAYLKNGKVYKIIPTTLEEIQEYIKQKAI